MSINNNYSSYDPNYIFNEILKIKVEDSSIKSEIYTSGDKIVVQDPAYYTLSKVANYTTNFWGGWNQGFNGIESLSQNLFSYVENQTENLEFIDESGKQLKWSKWTDSKNPLSVIDLSLLTQTIEKINTIIFTISSNLPPDIQDEQLETLKRIDERFTKTYTILNNYKIQFEDFLLNNPSLLSQVKDNSNLSFQTTELSQSNFSALIHSTSDVFKQSMQFVKNSTFTKPLEYIQNHLFFGQIDLISYESIKAKQTAIDNLLGKEISSIYSSVGSYTVNNQFYIDFQRNPLVMNDHYLIDPLMLYDKESQIKGYAQLQNALGSAIALKNLSLICNQSLLADLLEFLSITFERLPNAPKQSIDPLNNESSIPRTTFQVDTTDSQLIKINIYSYFVLNPLDDPYQVDGYVINKRELTISREELSIDWQKLQKDFTDQPIAPSIQVVDTYSNPIETLSETLKAMRKLLPVMTSNS